MESMKHKELVGEGGDNRKTNVQYKYVALCFPLRNVL